MKKPRATLLITDLDDTIWHWFKMWHASFSAELEELEKVTGIARTVLMPQIKAVHERHHTSEYAFLLEELPCLREKYGVGFKPKEKLPTVIEAYRTARKASMGLYPSVLDTLTTLKAKGVRVVAFTESQRYYSIQRLRVLGLDGIIDVLYATPESEFVTAEQLAENREHDDSWYELERTQVIELERRLKKPNPKVLANILKDEKCSPEDAIYVGDTLSKDILMANQAGVRSAHAAYGVTHKKSGYDLLKAVTHWTPADVKKQAKATTSTCAPNFYLAEFAQLLDYVDFCAPGEGLSKEDLAAAQAAWTKMIGTQEHFNQMILQARNHLLTIVSAVIGASALVIQRDIGVVVFDANVSLATLILIAGFVIVLAFYITEKGYHHLLLGAVKQASDLELRLAANAPGIKLGHAIKSESSRSIFWLKLDSTWRIRFFYIILSLLFTLGVIATWRSIPQPKAATVESGVPTTPKANSASSIPNDPQAGTKALNKFHATGAYALVMEEVVAAAEQYVKEILPRIDRAKAVAVFDIDETALSTWAILESGEFTWDPARFSNFVSTGRAVKVDPVLRLYKALQSAGVPIIFITSRTDDLRQATELNLQKEGFTNYAALIMKPTASTVSTKAFKESARAKLHSEERSIFLAVGDQMDDLQQPGATGNFLLPNPFY